jgi:hypothetical protein
VNYKKRKRISRLSFSELRHSWNRRAKLITAWYIDTGERLAKDGASLQEKLTVLMTHASLAKVCEARKLLAMRLIEDSACIARGLWRVEPFDYFTLEL